MDTQSLSNHFINIATTRKTSVKKSSLIHDWLGFKCSQSASIRIGNYIEQLINERVSDNVKWMLDDNGTIIVDGKQHQVDHLLVDTDNTIWHLEAKCNLDLDRGKKRDVSFRETVITDALSKLTGQAVKSCVFCPLIEDSKQTSGLGYVMGMKEFISKFNPTFTLSEFNQLGKDPAIHSVL